MCGICGQFNFQGGDSGAPVVRRDLETMARAIAHRGPDDEGFHLDGPLGLGFRRLSIIDLAGGHQPMADAAESVWVAFNGEIYNFRELRQELEAHGHVFRTRSDTEVIIHGYKQWGDEVLNRLNGMFGLAVWDARRRRLLLARDAFGIKLIYYRIAGGRLWFGSEMRAVRAAMDQAPEVEPLALSLFLRYRFTPSPHTILRGIRKLAPGTKLVAENGACVVSRWYRFAPRHFAPPRRAEEAGEELLALYRQAVRRQLVSDVPLGLLLSGGMDSGLLLALMMECGREWPTYTVGYGSSYAQDELADAEETARILGSRHTSVRIDRALFEEKLGHIVSSLEEPIAASSIVPMYFVCQRARQDVKVGLVGQGPDELFAGYRRHLGARYGAAWARLPGWARRSLGRAATALPRGEALQRGIYALGTQDRMARYEQILSLLPAAQVDGLFRPGVLGTDSAAALRDCWAELEPLAAGTDALGGLQYLEVRSTLPDELLMYADKLSMAHGLELRVPFLDRDVVEFAERLPASMKVRRGVRKWLHRRVCRHFLPAAIVGRPKRGFAVNVVDDWFRNAVGGRMAEVFADPESAIYRYLQPAPVQALYAEHAAGRRDYHKVLFSLIVFEQWLRQGAAEPVGTGAAR